MRPAGSRRARRRTVRIAIGALRTDWNRLAGKEAGTQRGTAFDGQRSITDFHANLTGGPGGDTWPYIDQQAYFVAPQREESTVLGALNKTSRTIYDYNTYAQGQVTSATNQLGPARWERHEGDVSIPTDNWHIDRTFAFGLENGTVPAHASWPLVVHFGVLR